MLFKSLDVCDRFLSQSLAVDILKRLASWQFVVLHRKEVIQPHLPIQLPCYDLAPINGLTLGVLPLAVG